MPAIFADRPCYDAATLYEECQRIGYPTDWSTKANRFDNRAGHLPGTGLLLMRRADLDAISLNEKHDLEFLDGDNPNVKIKSIHVAGTTTCLTPGIPEDENSIHLVPVADDRRMWQLATMNAGYNLRITPNGSYVLGTAPAEDTAYTWEEVWADLWGRLPTSYAGTLPTLPPTRPFVSASSFGPAGTPDNFAYWGWTVGDAIGHFLDRCGYTLVRDLAGEWSVVEIGVDQANLESSQSALLGRRLWDIEPVSNRLGVVPSSILVYFRKSMGPRSYGQSPFVSARVAAPSPIVAGETGELIIHDDMLAEFNGTTIVNQTELDAQANLRAVEFYRVRRDWFADPERKVYSGAIKKILPGSKIESVSWIDAGHGVMTETRKMPMRDPVEKWAGNKHQPWRLAEWVRIKEDVESGAETPPTGYQSGRVTVWNPETDDWEPICLCWWKGANEETGVEDWRYFSRFKGHLEGRPVFVGGCCEGSEGGTGGGGSDGGGTATIIGGGGYVDHVIPDPGPLPYSPRCNWPAIYANVSNALGCPELVGTVSFPLNFNAANGRYEGSSALSPLTGTLSIWVIVSTIDIVPCPPPATKVSYGITWSCRVPAGEITGYLCSSNVCTVDVIPVPMSTDTRCGCGSSLSQLNVEFSL